MRFSVNMPLRGRLGAGAEANRVAKVRVATIDSMTRRNFLTLGIIPRGLEKRGEAVAERSILPVAAAGLGRFKPPRKRAVFIRGTQKMPDPGLTPQAPKIKVIY